MYKFSTLQKTLTTRLVRCSLALAMVLTSGTGLAADPAASSPKAAPAKPASSAAASSGAAPSGPRAAATGASASSTAATSSAAASAAPASAGPTAAPGAATPSTAPAHGSQQPSGPSSEQRDEARLAFEAGSKAYAEGQFETAVAAFKKAYALIPSPHAEYWIALSMDKADPEMKDPRALATAYETFLTNPGAGHVGAAQVEAAQARLAELRAKLPATVMIVSTPPGAKVTINGEPKPGVTPLTLELPAGSYQVGLNLEGYDAATVEVKAEGGLTLEQQVTLAQSVVAPPPEAVTTKTAVEPEPKKKSMVPAIVTLSLGGIGLISGTIFGILALDAKSKFKDDPTTEHADAAERNALIADMSFGIALTLGLTGIVLITSDDASAPATAKKKSGTHVAFSPYASPFGGGAAARVRF